MKQFNLDEYKQNGFFAPLEIFSQHEIQAFRKRFEAYEAENDGWYELSKGQKLYLLQTWVSELATNTKILNIIEEILGKNILVWGTSLFVKEPKDQTFVSWHQDSTYWGLTPPEVVTAWIALSPSTLQSGCMKMIPGSQTWGQIFHEDSSNPKNLLTRGQKIKTSIDESQAVNIELKPGEISLHHIRTTHASGKNLTKDRRIGLAIRYVAPQVKQLNSKNDSAWLVRGEDRFRNFIHETPPSKDMDISAITEHSRIMQLRQSVLYKDSKKAKNK